MKIITLGGLVSLFILCSTLAYAQADVLTQHNDLKRTGWNPRETILTPATVNSSNFKKLFSRPVDDQIYTQPLVVTGVSTSAGTRNLVIVATVNNTIYAFDADSSSVTTPYWQKNFTPAGNFRPPNKNDIHPELCGFTYTDFTGKFGIVGTPVIDKANNVLYVVSRYVDNSANIDQGPHIGPTGADVDTAYSSRGFYQLLHAIDIRTGNEKSGSPVVITAQGPGTGAGNYNGVISFDPRRNNQRGGLVLSNGILYIPYASHCDWGNYHGWLLGYDPTTLQQRMAYITTPNDGRGGMWMSGAAPAVDDDGNIYFTTGNGQVGNGLVTYVGGTANVNAYPADGDYPPDAAHTPDVAVNRGESVVKLTPNTTNNTLTVSSFFTPSDYIYLNDADLDFPTQVLLIPNTNMALTGGKDNNLYLMSQSNLGGFTSDNSGLLQAPINVGSNAEMHSSFAYFGGSVTPYVYQFSENTALQAFPVGNNSLGTPVNSGVSGPSGSTGAFMSISSNGTNQNSGILWINQSTPGCNANASTCPGVLRAVNANNVNSELWNSTLDANDNVGTFGKMSCPTVANGKVYLSTFANVLNVYGTKPSICNNNTNVAKNLTHSSYTASANSTNVDGTYPYMAFDGDSTTTFWKSAYNNTGGTPQSDHSYDNAYLQVDLGQSYKICKIIITWQSSYNVAVNYDMQVSTDGSSWTTIQSVAGKDPSLLKDTIGGFSATARYVRLQCNTSSQGYGYIIYEMAVYGDAVNPCTSPSGLGATSITQNSETLNWQAVPGATGYNIQYRNAAISSWVTKTATTNSITLDALECGTTYYYNVQTVCASGISDSTAGSFNTANCNPQCSAGNRRIGADIGDVGVAGSSCYNTSNQLYTIKGSGAGIGGNSDAFQFDYETLTGDNIIAAQVQTIDATSSTYKVGLMIRDSASNTSRFAFIGFSGPNGIVFEYRSASGGATTTITHASINVPYWLRLQKIGTSYQAAISPDNVTWTTVGTAVDLGFGNSSSYAGFAVSSADNTVLTTATIGSYYETGNPLPISLTSFTATNVNNAYVSLKWTTSSEVNNNYFDVERSIDKTNFVLVTTVKADGNGNSTIAQNYIAQDPSPEEGTNFYRLKQVDKDNNFTYSGVIPVQFGRNAVPMVFPNPAISYISVIAGQEPMQEIILYSVGGKALKTVVNTNGAATVTISAENLAAGVYIVQIRTATSVYQQKVIKQ